MPLREARPDAYRVIRGEIRQTNRGAPLLARTPA
jgi:hypothetical protein